MPRDLAALDADVQVFGVVKYCVGFSEEVHHPCDKREIDITTQSQFDVRNTTDYNSETATCVTSGT